MKRWQIFAHNHRTGRIDAFNVERTPEGLFDTRGTRFFTCPDHPELFTETEGPCPYPSVVDEAVDCPQSLVPMIQKRGFAETALAFDGETYVEVPALAGGHEELSIVAWIRPDQAVGQQAEPALAASR